MFVACDGPNYNRPEEVERVLATRAVIEKEIDWPCRIERLYSNVNQGCRLGASRAITWFFNHVPEGIILEDDCLPTAQFLHFCRHFLEVYRLDKRVASIGGHNPIKPLDCSSDIIFSKYFECWGWATWSRAWRIYDDDMVAAELYSKADRVRDFFRYTEEWIFWRNLGKKLLESDSPSSWAYRFQICCAVHNMVHAISSKSLVENIGFGPDGTNCAQLIPQKPFHDFSHLGADKGHFEDFTFKQIPIPLPERSFDVAYARLHGIRFSSTFREKAVQVVHELLRLFRKNLDAVLVSSKLPRLGQMQNHPRQHSSVLKIEAHNKICAIIIPSGYQTDSIEFFTPDDFSQQLGYMNHPSGYVIPPHVHNPCPRKVQYTKEVLFIKSGRVRVDFYADDQTDLESLILETGDVILLAYGGHGFEMLEPTEMIEVKQGPYAGDMDKTRFEGISAHQAMIKP